MTVASIQISYLTLFNYKDNSFRMLNNLLGLFIYLQKLERAISKDNFILNHKLQYSKEYLYRT